MVEQEITIWGIHGGRTGDADSLFLKKGYIAIGWTKIGDLGQIQTDREAFKSKVAQAYPEKKAGAIPNNAGQLYRFVYEMRIGDLIVYPSKQDRRIHIGEISGPYQYDPILDTGYPNQRAVKWLRTLPRTAFKLGALSEIGSAMSLFQVRNYSDEFRIAAKGKLPDGDGDDETIHWVTEEVEQNTRDFVLKQLAKELKGHPLAHFVSQLLNKMGYRTKVSPEGTDGGVDIVAHKDELGFEPPIIKVQVKSSEGNIGDPIVSALYGKVGTNEFGLLVTLGSFTQQARNFAVSKTNLRLIDGLELVNLVLEHYEQFDSTYKALLPLKRVYIPEVIEDADE